MSEAQQPSAELDFPHVAPRRGKYYVTDDGFGGQMVISSHETWVDFGTTLESLRAMAKAQDSRIKELLSTVAAAGIAKVDAETRLNNLRDVRRAEKRADFDGVPRIIVPDTKLDIKGR